MWTLRLQVLILHWSRLQLLQNYGLECSRWLIWDRCRNGLPQLRHYSWWGCSKQWMYWLGCCWIRLLEFWERFSRFWAGCLEPWETAEGQHLQWLSLWSFWLQKQWQVDSCHGRGSQDQLLDDKAMFLNANDVDLAFLSGGDKFVELAGVVKSSNIESAISWWLFALKNVVVDRSRSCSIGRNRSWWSSGATVMYFLRNGKRVGILIGRGLNPGALIGCVIHNSFGSGWSAMKVAGLSSGCF